MSRHRTNIGLSFVMALTSVALLTTSAFGQSRTTTSNGTEKAFAAQESRSGNTENKVAASEPKPAGAENKVTADEPKPKDVQAEIEAVKAENAAVRELLRKMEEQQKTLLEQVDRLQRRLDGGTATDASIAGQPIVSPTTADASAPAANAALNTPPAATNPASTSGQPAPVSAPPPSDERYGQGIVLVQTSDDARVPLLVNFNVNTQLRYLNTLNSEESFTDHLGNVREVHTRNDITVNRAMFILGGYIFDKRARYSFTVWTSAGAASIVVAGNIGWQFNKHLTLMAGYTGVPGSRSLVNTFPYYTATDRSMADNFFRPGFTQGLWATGELSKGLNYQAFVGNGLNTLSITANKIDTNLLFSGSLWWEPLGGYGEPGKSVNMYDDYFAKKKVRIRLGTSFTRSREDRFSDLDQSSPENTSIYNSDGVLMFSTGAFAPGVTVNKALYKMWAIDGGLKYNGLAINGQYFTRWLSDFEADGPMPVTSTLDHGYEFSASYFVIPKKLLMYGRSSQVFGQFGDQYEYGGGVKWHFLQTERLWLNAELFRINRAPYSGAFTPYTAGMTGWVPMVQTVIAF
jgi:TolA-binding protein